MIVLFLLKIEYDFNVILMWYRLWYMEVKGKILIIFYIKFLMLR